MDPAATDSPALWRVALPWCALGLAVRLTLLLLAGEPELHQDEANYVYLALAWERFGVLGDGERYLWPPLWTGVLRTSFELFGRDGLLAAKLLIIGSSPILGASLVGLALRTAGLQAARVSGALWATYLPLAAFTHLLWAEPLFMLFLVPALFALVEAERRTGSAALRWTLLAGLLLGGSLLAKEAVLFLVPILALGLWWVHRREGARGGLQRASLLLLAVASVLAPWTARNFEFYGHLAPSGASLGANAFNGLNAHQLNFDVLPLQRQRAQGGPIASISRPAFEVGTELSPWPTAAEVPNTVERSQVELRRGLRWVQQQPSAFLLSRIKRLADFVLPTSYFVRHHGLRRYPGALGGPVLRRSSALLAVGQVALLLLLAVPGLLLLARQRRPGAWVLLTLAGYVTATSLLVSSSRFRVPLLPVLFIAAALTLTTPGLWRERDRGLLFVGLGWAGLLFLWWVDLPELRLVLESAW